jgi:hypothetical protein
MEVEDKCPVCGLLFNRESGYFLGAMYIEYGLASAVMAITALLLRSFMGLRFQMALVTAFIVFLPFIPVTVRLSRTLWIYWDNAVDPQRSDLSR